MLHTFPQESLNIQIEPFIFTQNFTQIGL